MEESDSLPKLDLEKGADYIIIGSATACLGLIFFAGSAISFAVLTGMFSTISVLYLLFCLRNSGKVGKKTWNWCMQHGLTTDVLLTVGFCLMFGVSSATALLAAGTAGITTSAFLNLVKKYSPNNGLVDIPEDIKQLNVVEVECYKIAAA